MATSKLNGKAFVKSMHKERDLRFFFRTTLDQLLYKIVSKKLMTFSEKKTVIEVTWMILKFVINRLIPQVLPTWLILDIC